MVKLVNHERAKPLFSTDTVLANELIASGNYTE